MTFFYILLYWNISERLEWYLDLKSVDNPYWLRKKNYGNYFVSHLSKTTKLAECDFQHFKP